MCAPHHPKAGGLTEWWNGLLKTTAPARWQCLAGLRQGFPESYMCPESSNTRCCFSHSPDCWIKGWKWEWHHLLFCPVTSTCKNCSFCSHDFIISWLRGLSSKGGNTSTRKYSNNSTELEVKLPPRNFGLLMPLNEQKRRQLLCWLRWLILTTEDKLDCYSAMEVRKSICGIWQIP